jgi:hypothetical protein
MLATLSKWVGTTPCLQNAGTFVAADMTNPATATTGDVRGTFTPHNRF